MDGKQIRESLRSGQRVYATAMVAPSSLWPQTLRKTGIDFVFIDSEHTPLGRESLSWLCRSFSANGIAPVVRIPSPDPFEASKVLDGGAAGIIAPYIETAEQVRQLMGPTRYRPLKGERLQEALSDPSTLEPELRTYLEERNAGTVFIANIESTPGLRNLEEVVSLGALDSVLIGPHDLSCSLGIPEQYDHPRFEEAVGFIFQIARKHNCGAGLHWWSGVGEELDWVKAGANLIMHSTDVTLVAQHLENELNHLKSTLGDATGTGATETTSV